MADIVGTEGDDELDGTDQADAIAGNGGNDRIYASPGEDTLDGGAGQDIVEFRDWRGLYAPQLNGVMVDLAAGIATNPWGEENTLIGIEDILGSQFDDVIYGDSGGNGLVGDAGDDYINGGGGPDFLFGGDGNDTIETGGVGEPGATLFGNRGNDILQGGDAEDNLNGGPGDDSIDGGPGSDRLAFFEWGEEGAPNIRGVVVDFFSGIATDAWGDTDTFSNIEDVAGTEYDDVLLGDDGDNRFDAGGGDDLIEGNGGDDRITGGDGNDILRGGQGNDYLVPGPGNDDVDGGAGDDFLDYRYIYLYIDPDPPILEGIVLDLVTGAVKDSWGDTDTIRNIESVSGTALDDTLLGDANANDLNGSDGNDYIEGRGGDDWLDGGDGDDSIIGGTTDEHSAGNIFGGPGNDSLDAGGGNFFFFPGSGDDVIKGGPIWASLGYDDFGSDELPLKGAVVDSITGIAQDPWGGTDTFTGILEFRGTDLGDRFSGSDADEGFLAGGGNDWIVAGDGNDGVEAGPGDDTVDGEAGNDNLHGGPGDDTLLGGEGDDWLYGGEGNDTVDGGAGFDFYAVSGDSLGGYDITEDADGTITIVDINTEDGDDGTDILVNVEAIGLAIQGTDEDDVIFFEGDEAILAIGGKGDDRYILKNEADYVFELPNEGTDIVEAGISRTLEPNVENLMLTGDADVSGTGNNLRNKIEGNVGDNILDGRGGADVLRGGAGSDTYYVDNRGDSVIETGSTIQLDALVGRPRVGVDPDDLQDQDVSDDIDQVIATISYALTDFVENLTLGGLADIDGTGNGLDNEIIGNAGANVLSTGSGGDDTLIGGAGDDTYLVQKTTGTTLISDNAGEANLLDLSAFVGSGSTDDLQFSQPESSNTLRIANAYGGTVDVENFFGAGGVTVQYVDFGEGAISMSGVATAEAAASAAVEGAVTQIIDADGNLYDSKLRTPEGETISAAEAQLFRTYSGALGRTPDQEGYDWWLNQIAIGNHDLRSMAAGFLFSEEFTGFFGAEDGNSIENADFLNHMYLNVFSREPDQAGFSWWLNELETGNRTQAETMVEMTQSNEYVEQTVDQVVDYLIG